MFVDELITAKTLNNMSWKSEAREVKQQKYGNYCNLCRKHNIEIVPYHQFTFELYNEIRLKIKNGTK